MAKSWMSAMQTVTTGHVSRGMGIKCEFRSQGWGSSRVSKIEAQGPWENIPEDTRLMIIELGKYNNVGALLIEKATGSRENICYQDGDWRVL